MGIRRHVVGTALVEVLDKAEVQGTTTVLVSLELGDGRLSSLRTIEANHAGSSRPATGLVLNLSLLNLADGGEELDQVVIAGRPWELGGG